jgi:hypothetical protein
MVKCPFCGFDNEDGAIFCEQCKSDLSAVPASPAPIPVAAVMDDVPFAAPVADAVAVPSAEIVEAMPAPVATSAPMDTLPIGVSEPVVAAAPAAPATDPVVAAAAATAPAAAPSGPVGQSVAPGSQVKLVVRRGQKVGAEYPIYPDYNYIGRADEKPVDVDLEDQEPPDRVWCSRQHAVIHFDDAAGVLTIEDLNSSNGTYVNRNRVYPGQKKQLMPNDTVQIGTVHLQVKV